MDESRRCTAKNNKGGPCRRPAILGGNVCPSHGGRAPRVKAKALERVTQDRTVKEFARLGMIDRVDDPIGAMHDRVSESVAWLDHLRHKVSVLEGDYATWSGETGEQVKAVVKLYVEALGMSHKFLESWIRLGMDERRLKLDATKTKLGVDAIVAALDWAFAAEGVSADVAQRLKVRIGTELEKVIGA